jgi:transcriptional regulator with XRE-family HTH domain
VRRGKQTRAQFVSSQIDKGIAYQLRALRDRQELSQEKLAELVGMNQNAISRLESPRYGRPTISTLKRLAAAFDVALVVRFVPFSYLVKWVSGTPFVENGLSTERLAVPSFDEEMNVDESDLVRDDEPFKTLPDVPERHGNKVVCIDEANSLRGTKQQSPLAPVQTESDAEGGLARAACVSSSR